VQIFCTKGLCTAFLKLQSQNVTRKKLRKALLYKKIPHKMFMKLTPGAELSNPAAIRQM